MRILILLLLVSWSVAAQPITDANVVLVMLDGVGAREWSGGAKDDRGRPIPRAALFPELEGLRKRGTFFSRFQISNPVGISLPGYADILAGRRQKHITSNTPDRFYSKYPTVFQTVKTGLKLRPDQVALISSWSAICPIAMTPDGGTANDFHRSCGWKPGLMKGEVFAGSRSDTDTFVEVSTYLPKHHPRFTFVHFGDADEEAHLHADAARKHAIYYGVFGYHQGLRAYDYYVGRIWQQLQDDPFYRGRTYLLVATDHGRDDFPDKNQWTDHGECIHRGAKRLCSGCRHAFLLALGPGLTGREIKHAYRHTSLAPTIEALLGVPGARTDQAIPELLPVRTAR